MRAGAGAKCDHCKLGVRTRVHAHLNLDVRGACVRPKKRSQLTPCKMALIAPADSYADFWCKNANILNLKINIARFAGVVVE